MSLIAMLGFFCIRNQSLILLQLRTMVTQIFISQHFSYTFTFQGWSVNNIEHHLFDLLILRKDLGSDINASRPLHAAKPLNSSGPMLRVRGWDAAAVGWGWGWAVLHPSNKVAWSVWAKKKVSVSRQRAVRPVELCWYKSFGAQVILSAQTA